MTSLPPRAALALVLLAASVARADPVALNAGATVMSFPAGQGITLTGGYRTDSPAVVVTDAGTVASAPYDHVGSGDGVAVGSAAVVTPNGSRFAFTDRWAVTHDGAIRLSRTVIVTNADPRDAGFDTRFGLAVPGATSVRDVELFAPGVWYRHNEHVAPRAIGADPTVGTFLIKETRLALPMVMARPNAGGTSLSILHVNAHPTTDLRDADAAPQTDASIQFGSIGFYDGRTVGFCYPGTEGTVSYNARGPRNRFHPMRAGITQQYDLQLRVAQGDDFTSAMTDAWRAAYATYAPVVRPAPSTAIYQDGLAVFDRYYRDDFPGGGCGLPFMVWLGLHPPRGHDRVPPNPASGRGVSDYHVQGGFVGQQMAAAFLMLRDGLRAKRPDAVRHGSAMIDFWVAHSMSPAGVPRTDYFAERARWATGPVFLRTVSDATEGIVDAYHATSVAGRPRSAWLAYGRTVGDWLVHLQGQDGSWPRSVNPNGTVANPGKFNTTNPLRLLVKLHAATGEAKYLDAALKAGQWCLRNIDEPAAYVGGTTDNDNTIDKEAGVLALYGFQALYDATVDHRWLAAAVRAADYAETWTYAWSYHVAPAQGPGEARSPWPACGLVGQSLVATGHSYADMFMTFCSTPYYRLSLQSGDPHHAAFARLLADGANRPADLTGALNYPDRGEIEEGINPADFTGNGVGTCLTWCTVAQVYPVAQLQDVFGCDTIDEAEQMPDRAQRNRPWYAPRP